MQYAGNIGFISPGVGWAFSGPRLETDLFFGWVPAAVVGGEDIFSFTAKLTWLPWEIRVARHGVLRPLTFGLQLTYTLGEDFYVTLPSRYRPDYYDFPTALHAGFALGGTAGRRGGGRIRELGVYWELVGIDTMMFTWFRNTRALGLEDVFSLALGVRASF